MDPPVTVHAAGLARILQESASVELSQFQYDLPRGSIAQVPPSRRDASRLLLLPRRAGRPTHGRFRDLPSHLRQGDLLILNETRVRPARLLGRRETGGKVEALLLKKDGMGWLALGKSRGRPRIGERLRFNGLSGRLRGRTPRGEWRLDLDGTAEEIRAAGLPPLPPYIRRPRGPLPQDRRRYQTVFARQMGSVAAPTAGLHFTGPLLDRLRGDGVEVSRLTLHIGPGTFRPIRTASLEDHRMDGEPYSIPPGTVRSIEKARAEGRRLIAVGTSTTRALESFARTGKPSGETDLFIRPPFRFRLVDGLVTNFHLPGSTLICLVAALVGRERLLRTYEEARDAGYRFYSYGDAMLII